MAVLGAVVVVLAPVDGALEAAGVPAVLEAGAAVDVAGVAVGEVWGPATGVLADTGGGAELGGAPGPAAGGPGAGVGGSCLLPWTALKICCGRGCCLASIL